MKTESENTVTQETVNRQVAREDFITHDRKTTIGIFTLINGFVIVESSSCVDPKNYNEAVGKQICRDRANAKIWELEGYKLQSKLYDKSVNYCNTERFDNLSPDDCQKIINKNFENLDAYSEEQIDCMYIDEECKVAISSSPGDVLIIPISANEFLAWLKNKNRKHFLS
jgi:hypothetical protein